MATAPPAQAATTSPNSVLVDYTGQGQYQISTTTLTGPIGATFAFQNRINGQSLYLQNGTGSVSLGATNCTGNHTCGVAAGADGTYTVTAAGTISVNTDAVDGRFTITIVQGAGTSDAEPPRATLNFDANGGTCTTTTTGAVLLGTWATVPSTGTCTRPGWTLLGFSTSPTNTPGSVFIPAGGTTAVIGDNTLYAQWAIRVAADWTSAACPGAEVHDIDAGESVTLPLAKVCGTEILAGWGLSPALGTPVTYAPGQTVTPPENLTVWAVWSPVIDLTLTCQVASGSPADVVPVGRDLPTTLPSSCHGAQVSAWNTQADGTGTSYAAGASFRTTIGTVLYAQTRGTNVTITWHGNGGACPSRSTAVAWGSTFAPATCTRSGYAITDWTTDGTASGTSLLGSPLRSSVDAYPVWALVPVAGISWVYKCPAAFIPATWNTATRQFEMTLPAAGACDNEPYTLMSWNTSIDGSGTSVEPGETFAFPTSTFYAAQWGVPITFDYNIPDDTTTCPTTTVLAPFGRAYTMPAPSTCLREKYLLANWATTATWTMGVDPHLQRPGASLTALAPVTYYAWWGPPIEVAFDPDGGTCTTTSLTVGLGGLFPLPDTDDCTRTDYRLTGWAFTANATRPYLKPGATGMAFFFGQPRLVAQWVSTSHCSTPPGPNVDWHGCDKRYANLTGANLAGADLTNALVDYAQLNGASLVGADVAGASFAGAVLAKANLSNLNLADADMSGANLSEANLQYATLSKADLTLADLTKANLSSAKLPGATLSFATAPGASLTSVNLTGASLFMANLEGANLSSATMPGMDLTTARLTKASFANANLSKAKLARAKITGVSFSGATLDGADLTGVSGTGTTFASAHGSDVTLVDASLPGTILNGATLPSLKAAGITLTDAKVRGATLTGADLARAKLTKADFTDATLLDAVMTGMNLSDVDFGRANLGRVVLTSTTIGTANLSNASVQNVNLRGKDLSSANLPYARFGLSDLTGADLSNRDLTGVDFPNADLSNVNFQGAYTAKIGAGCQAENYYRNSQVIVRQPMRNLPVVLWMWRETHYNRRGAPKGHTIHYEYRQWGMDGSDFLMFCAAS